MLRRMKDLKGFGIRAKDGDVGRARDFVFDDKNWTVRYIVVDTSPWRPGGKVLISPIVTGPAEWEHKTLPVLLTREQVKDSPDIRMNEELSAQDEIKYYNHYGWGYYWVGGGTWGPGAVPRDLLDKEMEEKRARTRQANESHLRSMNEVTGYTIRATDGAIGQVDDFIIDDEPWVIRHIVVDTGNWWLGKKVIVAPRWISRVEWKDSNVYTNFSREAIKTAPEFASEKLDRGDEAGPNEHFRQNNDWWC